MKRLAVRLAAAAVLFVALAAWSARGPLAFFSGPLELDLVLEAGEPGRADPVIVSGRTGAGDFLAVRFDDTRTVRFTYDSWGIPPLVSAPVTIEPGVPLRLSVEMPGLQRIAGRLGAAPARIRVVARGAVVLDAEAHSYPRQPGELRFGDNPLGGTACGPRLRGRITAAGGRALDGDFAATQPLPRRIADWIAAMPHRAAALALACLALAAVAGHAPRLPALLRATLRAIERHRWFAGAALVATLGYAWLVTLGSFRVVAYENFGEFHDYQAASLLTGRLDVPEDAIGGEAFEARGKLYGYFGPAPAVLRMPFVIFGSVFGELSRAFMLVYFAATLVAAYLLLREALRWTRPDGETNGAPPSPFATVVLVANVGWGSVVFFTGCRAIVFHEAILSGITFALWSAWCALRHLRAPAGGWWIGALACGVASVHCRPPTGLFALTLLGCVAVAAWWRSGSARWAAPALPRALLIGALAVAGQLSLNGLAWLKFRTFDPAPLRMSRPYTEPGRLEKIDGKSFHPANIPFGFYSYFVRANLRLEPGFPWIHWHAREPGRHFEHAKIDLADHTVAVPWSTPGLFALAMIGSAAAAWRRPRTRPALAVLWLALGPMALALFAAVAIALRYTGDFCPWLIAAAAFGLAMLETAATRAAAVARAGLVALTLAAVAVMGALTIHYQGDYLWGVPDEVKQTYREMRARVDGWFGSTAPP